MREQGFGRMRWLCANKTRVHSLQFCGVAAVPKFSAQPQPLIRWQGHHTDTVFFNFEDLNSEGSPFSLGRRKARAEVQRARLTACVHMLLAACGEHLLANSLTDVYRKAPHFGESLRPRSELLLIYLHHGGLGAGHNSSQSG